MTSFHREVVGLIAGSLTTGSFVPQVIKLWRRHRPKPAPEIPISMYVIIVMGAALWIYYGILIGSMAAILSNAVALGLTVSILLYKFRYR